MWRPPKDWEQIAARILAGDEEAAGELRQAVETIVKSFHVDHAAFEDYTQDVTIALLDMLRRGEVRDTRGLMGLARIIAQRLVIASEVRRRRLVPLPMIEGPRAGVETMPDAIARRELVAGLHHALGGLRAIDRDILQRFYYREHSAERIRADLQLTETQFRLRKSRAIGKTAKAMRRARCI